MLLEDLACRFKYEIQVVNISLSFIACTFSRLCNQFCIAQTCYSFSILNYGKLFIYLYTIHSEDVLCHRDEIKKVQYIDQFSTPKNHPIIAPELQTHFRTDIEQLAAPSEQPVADS